MPDSGRLRALRAVLFLVGLVFIFGIYTLGIVWPSGWVWGEAGPRSFLPSHFWSSFVHAGIMAVEALTDGKESGHLVGDVPALLMVALVLAALTPRGRAAGTPRE